MTTETGFGLPVDMQSEADRIRQRQQIAQMLMQAAMQQQGTQMLGPVAVRQSPFAGLARAAAGAWGGYQAGKTPEELRAVQMRAFTEGQGELEKLQQMDDPQARIAAASASRFPGIRQQAATWAKDEGENRRGAVKGLFDVGLPDAGLALARTGRWQDTTIPDPKAPQVFRTPEGRIDYAIDYNRAGVPSIKLGTPGTQVNVENRMAGREGELELTRQSEELSTRQKQAQTAMSELATAKRLNTLYEEGLRTGGGESLFQVARKVGSALGVDIPATGMTDSARNLLGERLLARAKALGSNPSEGDAKRIAEIVGTIDTDPTAIGKMNAWISAQALKSLQDFNEFVRVKQSGARGPIDYSTAAVGVRMPTGLFGDQRYQLGIMQALQEAGGDITQFTGPDGRPFAPDTQFRISSRAMRPGPATATPAKPADMSDADWQELLRLRQQMGGR